MKASSTTGRRGVLASLVLGAGLMLSGCLSPFSDLPPGNVGTAAPAAPQGESIGAGAVRVALILPLSAPGQAGEAAASMRNAAELALAEFQEPDIAIVIKDDMGSPEGARAAAQEAIAEGAELILGPLFAPAVEAAGSVARASGVPVIAFSTDVTVATRGVYLMGFLPQNEVRRVVEHAAQQGRRSVAALIPETVYGNVVEAQFREAAAQRGLRVVAVERYPAGQPQSAVARIASVIGGRAPQADALFMPETPDGVAMLAQALQGAGFDPARVKPIGTGVWSDPAVLANPMLQGGWFAAPDRSGFESFAQRYQARYGTAPVRIASLAYDAVSLAAALTRTQGSQRFDELVLTNPSGFAGADGVFRFTPTGENERGLAVLEIRDGSAITISPAPRALGGGGA